MARSATFGGPRRRPRSRRSLATFVGRARALRRSLMPESLFLVSKGRIMTNADSNLRHPTVALYEGLRAAPRMSDRAATPEMGVLEQSDKPHVDEEFFGKKWWPEIAHKEDIVREGYLKARQHSIRHVG